MIKFFLSFSLVLTLFSLNITSALGASARILSNEELDQVHAGGLNFDFDKFLSVLPIDPSSITSDVLTEAFRVSYNPITTQSDTGNVKILSNTTQPTSSAATSTQPTSSTTQATPATILNDAINSLAALEASQNVATNSTNTTNSNTPASTTSNTFTTAQDLFNQIQNKIKTPVQLDVVANTNGTASIDVSNPLDTQNIIDNLLPGTDTLSDLADSGTNVIANNGTANIVDVSDTAQQYLSALVNINSAGSTVPVTINLTVVINSTVENISNSNQVNLQNLHTYNF